MWRELPEYSVKVLPEWLRAYAERFLDYAETFMGQDDETDSHVRLKCAHTFRVVQVAMKIAQAEDVFQDAKLVHILLLAALFHDIARFEQYARFKTFADPLSFNHGHFAVSILYHQKILYAEPKEVRLAILQAIAVHNSLRIPDWKGRLVFYPMLALRDADKLDILRIMQEHLGYGKHADNAVVMHLKDEPDKFSPAILQALEEGRVGLYQDMRYFNDFRLLLCSWVGELYFKGSRQILMEQQLLASIIRGLATDYPLLAEKAQAAVTHILQEKY